MLLRCFVLFLGPLSNMLCDVVYELLFLCVVAAVVLWVLSLLLRVVFV